MKLSDYKDDYYVFSGLASSASRQLAFAGIALLWLFKSGDNGAYKLPKQLFVPAAALIIALACDILHYVTGSLIWGTFFRSNEKKTKEIGEDPELEAPSYYSWPITALFFLKIIAVIFAYYHILIFAISAIKFQ